MLSCTTLTNNLVGLSLPCSILLLNIRLSAVSAGHEPITSMATNQIKYQTSIHQYYHPMPIQRALVLACGLTLIKCLSILLIIPK